MDSTNMPAANKMIGAIDQHRIFLIDAASGRQFTYREWSIAAWRCKENLQRFGLSTGGTVCVMLPNSPELALMYFGALLAGLRVVPIDPEKGVKDMQDIFATLPKETVIVKDLATLGSDFFAKEQEDAAHAQTLWDEIDLERPYLNTFTSGSTGVPKGVVHSFGNLAKSAAAFGNRFQFGKDNVFYHNLPMTYMAGILNTLFLPFLSGSMVVLGDRFRVGSALNFWDMPIRYGVNTFWFLPAVLAYLLKFDTGASGVSYAKQTPMTACVCTAPLSMRVREAFEARYGFPLYESYGLSETLFVSTQDPYTATPPGSVGRPLDGIRLGMEDDGEILIAAPWMFSGYSNVSRDESMAVDSFRSGDLGKMDDGVLTITGRKKDIIIRGGINISPRRMEEAVEETGMVEATVIMGFPDEYLGEKTACFFVPSGVSWDALSEKSVRVALRENLGKEYHIDEFIELSDVPRNINGKIDKLRLRSMYDSRH